MRLGLACAIGVASAEAGGPPADDRMDPQLTEKSPDGYIIIEPYTKSKDDDVTWQFWIVRTQ